MEAAVAVDLPFVRGADGVDLGADVGGATGRRGVVPRSAPDSHAVRDVRVGGVSTGAAVVSRGAVRPVAAGMRTADESGDYDGVRRSGHAAAGHERVDRVE